MNDIKLGFHGDLRLSVPVEYCLEKSDVFIETGTNQGRTLKFVGSKFPELPCYSCEIDPKKANKAISNCKGMSNVNIFTMGSIEFLNLNVIQELGNKTATFWVDAHGNGFEWPLQEEIEIITSTFDKAFVFIDDFKVPRKKQFGYDAYNGQRCSYKYIKDHFQWDSYDIYYPDYEGRTETMYHPLRGWGLFTHGVEFDHEIFEWVNPK